MVEVKLGQRIVQMPYTLRVPGVTDEQFDELVTEDTHAELIHGVMVVPSPASLRHDEVVGFLHDLLAFYVDSKEMGGAVLGPDGLVRLAAQCRFGPDLFFVRAERIVRPLPREYAGVPDLVMEVLSPSNRDDDLDVKRPVYRQKGVGEIWLVDLDNEQVMIDRRRRRKHVEEIVTQGWATSQVIPGFAIDVEWLWQDPLPNRVGCLRRMLQ